MTTNAVKFSNYAIVLERDQLYYYIDGILRKVADVSPEFTPKDLFSLAERISNKKFLGKVEYVKKDSIIKK